MKRYWGNIRVVALGIAMGAAFAPASLAAQDSHAEHDAHVRETRATAAATAGRRADPAAAATTASMGKDATLDRHMSAHMRMTPTRARTSADSARAAAVVATMHDALAKYRDVRVAEAEGFKIFAPEITTQRVYHFTHYGKAFKEHFRFDPTQPTSLLYRKDPAGQFVLVGAMYVAPKRASEDDLDARIPLSVAQWHAHTNICVPKRGQRERWREMRGGQMLFGPTGAITTKEDCASSGGRFHEQLFGWMVHANAFESDDPAMIWGGEHGKSGEHEHSH